MKKAVYQGHGQVESYNINSALWGVISHEQRHKNFNKYISSLKNEDVEQDVKITIQYKDGQPVPVEAYTNAKFHKKINQERKEEEFLKVLFLNFKKSKLKKEIAEAKDDKKLKKFLELKNIENELEKVQKNLLNNNNLENPPKHRKEHAKFYGIYDFEKFDLPPVIMSDPFISGYKIYQKLMELRSDSSNSVSDSSENILETRDEYRDYLVNAWEELYSKLNKFNSFLNNFKINFNKIETTDKNKEYFEAELNSYKTEEKNISISVGNVAKSFIIYSKKFDDPYTDLNISGTFSINGVDINVETTDSLYDIAQKINWGEDTNYNGVLDYDENEDVNNNEELDGGTKEHGVFAYIEDNRLYLKNIETGDKTISFEDSDDILHDFNLIEDNPLNNSTYFPNILQNGENAEITINNKKVTSQSNKINLGDLTIDIKKITKQNQIIKIKNDDTSAYNDIIAFVNNYNAVIKDLNEKLTDDNFKDSFVALTIKRKLKISVFADIETGTDITDIGLDLKDNKQYLNELAISQASEKKFQNSLKDALNSLGIIENDDETIQIDKTTLKSSIKNKKDFVNKVFFSKNGAINRLKFFLEDVLDDSTGMIKNEIYQLSNDDLNEIKAFFIKEKLLTNHYEEKLSTLSKVIE